MDLGLKDKVVIVNGAGHGIGRAEALTFAGEGAKVVVTDISEKLGKRVSGEINASGSESLFVKMDIAKFSEVKSMVDEALQRFGRIDILVNNAGIADFLPIREISDEGWDRMMAVNVKGCFNTTKCVLDTMIAQKSGRIINTASVAGLTGTARHAHYSASKGAVISFSKAVAKEVAPYGITVNVIAPGLHDTTDLIDKEIWKLFISKTPVGRAGQPGEAASLCAWLASDHAGFITGQVISPNGGFYM